MNKLTYEHISKKGSIYYFLKLINKSYLDFCLRYKLQKKNSVKYRTCYLSFIKILIT